MLLLLRQGPVPDVAADDVYAMLVGWCCGQGNMQQALQLVEQMMDRHIRPGQYLSPDVLAMVQQVSRHWQTATRGAGKPWQCVQTAPWAPPQKEYTHAYDWDCRIQCGWHTTI